MASNIKGITIEIGGNTQPLQEAIKKVDSTAKNLKTELNSINRLLKFDPSNVTLLAQKQEVLTKSIQATEEKVQKLKLAQKQAKEQLASGKIGEEQYRALEREVIAAEGALNNLKKQAGQVEEALEKAGNESVEAGKDVKRFGESTKDATEESKEFSEKSKAAFAATTAAVVATIAAVGKMVSKISEAATASAQYADDINTMAAQFKVSTDTLQRFAYAADIVDVSVETFGSSLGKLTRNIGNASRGAENQTIAFNKLGVSIYDSNGNLRDTEEVFYDVIDALGELENETEADVYANDLFGRSFQDLNPLVVAGTQKLRALGDEAETVGAVMSQDALNSANAYRDSLDRLNNLSGVVTRSLSSGMAPALARVTDAINEKLADPQTQKKLERFGAEIGNAAEKFAEFAMVAIENGDVILGVIGSIGAGIAAWKISSVIGTVITSFKKMADAAKASGTSILATMRGLDSVSLSTVIGAIVAVIGTVATLAASLAKASEEMEGLKESATGLKDAASDISLDFERATQAFDLNSQKALALASNIEELNNKIVSGTLSTEELSEAQTEISRSVAEYNAIVGNAAILIDQETGAIQGGTSALRANTKELLANARASAYIDLYSKAVKGVAEAEIERNAVIRSMRSEYEKLTPIQQSYLDALEKDVTNQEYLSALWYQSTIVSHGFNGSVLAGVEALESANAAYDKNSQTMLLIEEAAQKAGISLDQTTEAIEVSGEAAQEAAEATEEATEEQIKYFAMLRDAATNTSNEIVLKEQQSFKERKKILKQNQEITADFVENRDYLMNQLSERSQAVLSQMTIDDARTLKDMVDLWKNGGQEQVNEYFSMLIDGYDSNSAIFSSEVRKQTTNAIEAGKEVASSEGGTVGERMAAAIVEKYAEGNEKIEEAAKEQIRDVFKQISSQVTQLQFATIGNRIGSDIAEGLRESYSKIDSAASSIGNRIKNRLSFNVSVNGNSKIPGLARGGIVSQEQIVRVAERGAEAIIPLDKLGGIMQSALDGRGTVTFSPVINFNSTKVSDSEAIRLARIVSREFAKSTGGRMS